MNTSDPIMGKFSVTRRSFDLVSEMPKNRQLIRLKQLAGEKVRQNLLKHIVDMTEEQRIILCRLNRLEQRPRIGR